MRRVKICGITNLEDAMTAIECGADALGFVFYKPSPRYIEPKKAREIVDSLPPFIERVGLFVNEDSSFINLTCKEAKMSLAQIHFDADESLYEELEIPYLPVVRVREEKDLEKFACKYRLVDAFVEGYGGEGKRIESSWFESKDCSKMILAGGLDSQNIKDIKKYNFYGFDVSSGVEASKGKKDKYKIYAFVNEAKS